MGRRRRRARASMGDIKERRRSPVRHIQLQGDVAPFDGLPYKRKEMNVGGSNRYGPQAKMG